MRELTTDLFVTVDGYAKGERSPAYFGYHGPELQRWIDVEMARPQIVVMGRRTYETLAAFSEPGDQLSGMPKVLVSRTLSTGDWGETQVVDSFQALRELKQQPGPPLRTMGSVSLVTSLVRAGAVDRLRLLVFPLVLGETGAEPIFDGFDVPLELVGTTVLDGRLVLLEYRP
jgi:dihydrofolate reductase